MNVIKYAIASRTRHPGSSTASAGERSPGPVFCAAQRLHIFAITALLLVTTSLLPQHLTIKSNSQSFVKKRYLVLKDEVLVRKDDGLSLSGSEVVFDTATQTAWGSGSAEQPLRLQHGNLWYTADYARVNLSEQIGTLKNAVITGCDASVPHWRLQVERATLAPHWVTARHISFRIGKLPVLYLPWLQVPVDGRLAGSALFPKFSYDQRRGLGVDYHLQYHVTPQVALKAGVQWRTKRGVVWHNAIRAHRDPTQTLQLEGWWGRDRGQPEYWLAGNGLSAGSGVRPSVILRGEYGSNRRVSQSFFHDVLSRDEVVKSSAGARWHNDVQQADCVVKHVGSVRQTPTHETRSISEAASDHEYYTTTYLPQVQWYSHWASESLPVSGAALCGGDVVVTRLGGAVQQEVGRVWAAPDVLYVLATRRGNISLALRPFVQARAFGRTPVPAYPGTGLIGGVNGSITSRERILSVGGAFLEHMIGIDRYAGNLDLYEHRVDEHDEHAWGYVLHDAITFRRNSFELRLSQKLSMGFFCDERWGADQLSRGPLGRIGIRPGTITTSWSGAYGVLRSEHQYDWLTGQFVFHDCSISAQRGRFELTGSVTHCDSEKARREKMFFDGGTFVSCGLKCYHNRYLRWWLASSWAYEKAHNALYGLRHEAGLAYHGHCWEISAGYRQERAARLDHHETQRSWFIKVSFDQMGAVGTTLNHWD